jgi:hypothetical protein
MLGLAAPVLNTAYTTQVNEQLSSAKELVDRLGLAL